MTDLTLEKTDWNTTNHVCPDGQTACPGGYGDLYEHRTSAWACSGGCGVRIRHWAREDEYEYLYNVVDSKGNADTLSLGTPSQSVIKTLKFETKWW